MSAWQHPSGAVGVIVKAPLDRQHSYRIRFSDGFEAALRHDQLVMLAEFKEGDIHGAGRVLAEHGLPATIVRTAPEHEELKAIAAECIKRHHSATSPTVS